VWAQLKAALNDSGRMVLKDSVPHSWFLDPAVDGLGTPNPVNEEQVLIHPVGTLHHRPRSATKIPNLFLSGDYVAVPIDLATMEGANTSARQAVNALPAGRNRFGRRAMHRHPAVSSPRVQGAQTPRPHALPPPTAESLRRRLTALLCGARIRLWTRTPSS
jgi:hypothetical protein